MTRLITGLEVHRPRAQQNVSAQSANLTFVDCSPLTLRTLMSLPVVSALGK
jgi:hypothetical protein